ncbi:hypothetical protein [Bartonella sp. MR63HLJHH]|uniref:hypothetical protein n=1 Tax=Bartonella sp. MR63HLJHH TaxID=3243558 RepID=UPI0035CFA78C
MWVKTLQERHAFNELALELKAVRNIGSWQSFCDAASVFLHKRKDRGAEWILYISWGGILPFLSWIALAKWV